MSILSKDNALHPTSELRWLYIDFNSYFASVEQQLRPALRGKPVAVVPVETDSTCAIAASYEAKAYGVKALLDLGPQRMRKVWGSVLGERMWYLLRGYELPDEETTRSTLGHSHVMAPELREPSKAKYVARRLTLKAASRLRRMGYYASAFHLSVRIENGPRIEASEHCYRAQDSVTFLHLLDSAWAAITRETGKARIRKVSMSLYGLTAAADLQPELFAPLPDADLKARTKAETMSRALDKINHRFGRDSVLVGMLPTQGRSFSGTKIAFTRIPDAEEFLE